MILALSLAVSFALTGAPPPPGKPAAPPMPDEAGLKKMTAKLAPVDITVDLSKLPDNERAALAKMVEAALVMDPLFLRQVWAGNEAMLMQLLSDRSPLGQERLHAFLQNKGPWDRIDLERPFIPGAPKEKPHQGNFYPAGATKAEIEKWKASLGEADKEKANGFFTTVRRGPKGELTLVPYSVEYQGELDRAGSLLREAAALTRQPTLKDFLTKRADAFVSNEYYESDVSWMKLDATLEPTIGPYEVYEDNWFNAKAAFEAFITVRDDAETSKLAKFSGELQEIEDNLPIDPRYRNPKIGALAPIRVVNEVYASGDANRGVQTAAYNLPNDEKIGKEMGTKRTMLKNVQELKFEKVLMPITKVALAEADQKNVAFDVFFTHILMHELMHGLGPHEVTGADGKKKTVREALEQNYSALEEAKADISGLFAMQRLVDKGVLDKAFEQTMYTTFLASSFRSIRFGLAEAHGRGIALQLNYLLDKGAYKVAKDGTFSVDSARVKDAVKALTAEIMTVQATGDKAKAAAWMKKMAVVRPEVQKVLTRLADVPVDIEPHFVTAEKLLAETRQAGGAAGATK
jgi:hypothetical protein